jgi:DsbC/DsbD-like thiol-disulfide interchange protein
MSLWDNGRWMCVFWLRLVVVLICLAPALAGAAPGSPMVRVELLSEVQSIAPGETFWVALKQRIAPGWHTYWVNPGDSGEPLSIEWTLPAGLWAGEIVWPYPARIPQGPAMSYGYTGEVVLLIPITAASDLRPGTRLTLRGQASWIVCEKICIPEESSLALTLPIAAGTAKVDRAGAAAITAARRALPTSSPWAI